VPFREPALDDEVLTFDPATLAQAIDEGLVGPAKGGRRG